MPGTELDAAVYLAFFANAPTADDSEVATGSSDTIAPTATIVVADTNILYGETSLVTITFSEAITGLTAADLTVPSGSVGTPASGDGGITWTCTLTPAASTVDATNVISLDMTGVADLAGNPGVGTQTSNNYAVDTTPPVASVRSTSTLIEEGNVQSFVVSKPTGIVNGDTLVAFFEPGSNGGANPTGVDAPAGWALLGSVVQDALNGGSVYTVLYVFTKLITDAGGEPSTYTFVTTYNCSATLAVVAVKDASAVANWVSASSGGGSDVTHIAPTVTMPGTGLLLCAFGSTTEFMTHSTPTDMTELADLSNAGTGITFSSVAVDSEARSAGATGTRTSTASAARRWVSFSIGIV